MFRYGSVVFDDYLYPAKTPVDTAIYGDEVAEYQWYRTKEREQHRRRANCWRLIHISLLQRQKTMVFICILLHREKAGIFGSVTSNVTSYPISIVDGGGGSGDGYFSVIIKY